MQECLSCLSNSGEKRISPGEVIYDGIYWQAEHVYPTGLLGWVVIVLKRHTDKLHELTIEEWHELGEINFRLINILHKLFHTEKEYSCCFAEMEGFRHVHFHVIPKNKDFNPEYTGSKAFNYLKPTEEESISKDEIIDLSRKLKFDLSS
ncbi:MAG: hypothetical protein ABI543_01055 [Ignavibacteria bacterium]